jgi:hypothetical protein
VQQSVQDSTLQQQPMIWTSIRMGKCGTH